MTTKRPATDCQKPERDHIKFMARSLNLALATYLMVFVAGCAAPRFSAEVSQFHTLSAPPAAATFVVRPADPEKAESLQFSTYAKIVAGELVRKGFREADDTADSDLVVLLNYSVGPGTQTSFPVPVYGYYPGQFRTVHGTTRKGRRFSAQVYDSGGYVPLGYAEQTETTYKRILTLDMLDAAKWRDNQTDKTFEARVISLGAESEIAPVMPLMIRALFVEFPAPSGSTRTIVLSPEE